MAPPEPTSRYKRAISAILGRRPAPAPEPGPIIEGTFTSPARLGATTTSSIAYPPGSESGANLPVFVVLHGYGGTHRFPFDDLDLASVLAQGTATGWPTFAIASVDGGNTYWHARESGDDASAMVSDEFLPLLTEAGLQTERVALGGWSGGGYGALLLASRLGPKRVAAVVASSPALWPNAADAPSRAFDSPENHAAHDLAGRQAALEGIPVWIDCGTDDFYYPAVSEYAAGFAQHPAGAFVPGAHGHDYWRRIAPAQLAFVADHLSATPLVE
jgi:enterochelin esterase-like enzyme